MHTWFSELEELLAHVHHSVRVAVELCHLRSEPLLSCIKIIWTKQTETPAQHKPSLCMYEQDKLVWLTLPSLDDRQVRTEISAEKF